MPRDKITILQIGDVHFPEAIRAGAIVDLKDKGFPSTLVTHIGSTPLQLVTRKIQWILEARACDAVIMMGDLTTRGNKVELDNCLKFLEGALLNREGTRMTGDQFLVLPGNHDVSREDAKSDDPKEKFLHINSLLKGLGLRETRINACTEIRLAKGTTVARILGTNTCIGCGSLRLLPELVRQKVAEFYEQSFSSLTSKPDLDALLDDFYETLDTPMVSDELIGDLHNQLASCNELTIISGHHNLI